jgi:hypothetical protein
MEDWKRDALVILNKRDLSNSLCAELTQTILQAETLKTVETILLMVSVIPLKQLLR